MRDGKAQTDQQKSEDTGNDQVNLVSTHKSVIEMQNSCAFPFSLQPGQVRNCAS